MTGQASAASIGSDSVAGLRAALGAAGGGGIGAALARLDWVARLPNRAAPGFFYLAGACCGWPVGGGGRSLAEAAGKLAGEASETLGMTAPPAPCDAPPDPAIDALWIEGGGATRALAHNLTHDRPVAVPAAAMALAGPAAAERRHGAPPAGLGAAAGADRTAAALAGLLELIERDAAAGWWLDGAPPRMAEAALAAATANELALLRAGAAAARPTALIELASPTGVPVACAFSRDLDGRGLALGLKAAADPGAAATGAVLELLQMEIGLQMARLRLAQGRAAEGDRGPLARAALDPERFAAFAARPPAARADTPADLDGLVARLAALGHAVTVADLPGPADGLAVVKVLAPGLRPMPGPGPARPDAPGAFAALM